MDEWSGFLNIETFVSFTPNISDMIYLNISYYESII